MTQTNIAGRPITGEIQHYSPRKRVQQHPTEQLLQTIDAALAFPEVEAIRWTQYTPYFNDGDPCYFGIHGIYVKFTDDNEGGDYGDGYHEIDFSYPRAYYNLPYNERQARQHEFTQAFRIWGRDDFTLSQPISDALKNVRNAIEGRHHEDAILEHFGDPAQVTATPQGFNVEFYDHD